MLKGIVVRCLEVHQCVCDRKGDHGIEDQFHYSVHRLVPVALIYPREIRESDRSPEENCAVGFQQENRQTDSSIKTSGAWD
jgi:hypothetical protein